MGVGGLVTDTWVVSERGCASAVNRDVQSGAPHTIENSWWRLTERVVMGKNDEGRE